MQSGDKHPEYMSPDDPDHRVVVGVARSICPRCNRTWPEHSDADVKACVLTGIGYVDDLSELDGEVANVNIVLGFNRDRNELFTADTDAAHPIDVDASTTDRLPKVELRRSELIEQRWKAIKHVGDTNRRIAELEGTIQTRPPCLPAEMPELRLKMIGGWDSEAWRICAAGADSKAVHIGLKPDSSPVSNYTRWEKETLAAADLWWIGADMGQIVTKAMKSIPGEVTLDDLPWPCAKGFAVLEHPWFGHDALHPDGVVVVDAVVWGPATLPPRNGKAERPVLSISSYRLLDFAAGLDGVELQLATTTGLIMKGRQQLQGLDGHGRAITTVTGREWIPLGRSEWEFGARLDAPFDDDVDIDNPNVFAYLEAAEDDRRFIASLWALIATKSIATVDERTADRAARRRAQRLGEKEPSAVKVVYLRRPEHAEHEPDDTVTEGHHVEWSHRWMVNAHPRLQAYGPGRKYRKLIMVPPYVKGPDDKPLVIKDTVRAVVR